MHNNLQDCGGICDALQTPIKQGTSHTGLFWDMGNWSLHRVENDPSVDFHFFTYLNMFSVTSFVIFDWLLNIFPQNILHFLQPVKSKTIGIGSFKGQFLTITLPEKLRKLLYTNGHISKLGVRTWFGIKLMLKVCSLQWYQKCVLAKMAPVSCFVRVTCYC